MSLKGKYQELYNKYKEKYPGLGKSSLSKKMIEEEGLTVSQGSLRRALYRYDESQSLESTVEYDSSKDDSYDDRSKGEIVRDESGRIEKYTYKILIRNSQSLEGEFTRNEMNDVYRLYSNIDGAGLNQRSVSRLFPNLTFRDFKRILRAFNITKDSIPVAPHILEEKNEEEIASIIRRNKENLVIKKIEEDRGKFMERALRKTQKELADLKLSREMGEDLLGVLIEGNSKIVPIKLKRIKTNEKKALNIYLSDMHIGARTKENSQFPNYYDESVVRERIAILLEEIYFLEKEFGRFEELNICNLGDAIDGQNGTTTRQSHFLPQNMDSQEQWKVFVEVLEDFIYTLHQKKICNKINFYSVGESNHGGDWEWSALQSLKLYWSLKYPGMSVEVFDKNIGHFHCGNHTFMITHGKDNEDMTRNMPLILTERVENAINDYMDFQQLFGDCSRFHLIKGDLHMSARQNGRRFTYKNVYSLYGASAWIHKNFGRSQAGTDYDIVWMNESRILEGSVKYTSR